jgi:hypothetical protein
VPGISHKIHMLPGSEQGCEAFLENQPSTVPCTLTQLTIEMVALCSGEPLRNPQLNSQAHYENKALQRHHGKTNNKTVVADSRRQSIA